MGGELSVTQFRVDGFEGFQQAVQGSHVDVVQLEPGRFTGNLTHIGAHAFSLSVGSFSVGIRTQRIATEPQLIIGMLLSSEKRVTHWSFDMNPGDILVIPPNIEHDGRFYGGSSYAALRLDPADVTNVFGGEAWMSDPASWAQKNHYQADPAIGMAAIKKLQHIVAPLSAPKATLSREAANFWQRAIIDTVTASVLNSSPTDHTGPVPSSIRLVHDVERYIDLAHLRPVHISEICSEFRISRRSLHRAFDAVLGIGPVTFLRQKRLCNIHSTLRASDPASTTISEVAMNHGILNLGRFAGAYRSFFGENPSQTLGRQN